MSCSPLLSRLSAEEETYEIDVNSKTYQVEVKLLENTEAYIHVMVAIDDGHWLRAMKPLTSGFIRQKDEPKG